MKVGIEGIPLFGERSGVGQYSKRLIEAAGSLDSEIDFEVIRQLMPHRRVDSFPIPPTQHLSYRISRWLPPIIYFQLFKRFGWTIPYDWAVLRKYDAILFLNFVAYPVSRRTKSLIVIHDLSYVFHKEYVSPRNQQYLEKFVPKSIKKASRVIAISENTRKEIVQHYGLNEKNIPIINPAVNHSMFKPQANDLVAKTTSKFGISRPYILSVGTIEPRKNLIGVLNAFEMLPEKIKETYSLVLVGGKGWLDDEINAKYNELSKKYSIIKTGYVEDTDLPSLYTGATVFVFPSFYEGFGIPPLEAMACGTPVITANNSSLPEVVGDAALLIDAKDTKALAKNMEQVLTNKKLSTELKEKGLEQSKKFSWEISAKKLIEVLKDLD